MARELVLVPKGKYEHLLKLVDESGQNEQSGGQIGNQEDIPPLDPEIKTKDSSSNERTSVASEDTKEENEENTGVVKPRLYVNKPLSEMPFDKSKALTSSKRKRVGTKASLNKKNPKRVNGKKGNSKARWINYVI